jgi:hypothetical protein
MKLPRVIQASKLIKPYILSIGLWISLSLGFLAGCVPGFGGAGTPPTLTVQIVMETTASHTLTPAPQATQTPYLLPTATAVKPTSSLLPSLVITATQQPTSTATLEVLPTEIPWPTATPIPAIETGTAITLTSLHMFDETTGWGVESTGHIVRTNDGGSSWRDVTPPQGQFYQKGGLISLDADTAWAVPRLCVEGCYPAPETAAVWRTSDGGQTWQSSQVLNLINDEVPSIQCLFLIALQFPNPQTGWLLMEVDRYMNGSTVELFRTTDSGLTWNGTWPTMIYVQPWG